MKPSREEIEARLSELDEELSEIAVEIEKAERYRDHSLLNDLWDDQYRIKQERKNLEKFLD